MAHHKAQLDKKKVADRAYYYVNVALKKKAAQRAQSEKRRLLLKPTIRPIMLLD